MKTSWLFLCYFFPLTFCSLAGSCENSFYLSSENFADGFYCDDGCDDLHPERRETNPLILTSAQNGSPKLLQQALEKFPDVNAPGVHGTALHAAAEAGNQEAVEWLLQHGADLNARDNQSRTPLMAVLHSCPLASSNKTETALYLIQKGADLTLSDHELNTPLHVAADTSPIQLVRLLIEKGCDVNARNYFGQTPLHKASNGQFYAGYSEAAHVQMVSLLIEKGADVNAKDNSALTPLHLASQHRAPDLIDLLIQNGAELESKDSDDDATPLLKGFLGLFTHEDTLIRLIEKGADFHVKDKKKNTLLHLACRNSDDSKLLFYLLERGLPLESKNHCGDTPLLVACEYEYGNLEAARLLISRGANVRHRNKSKTTPLHWAAKGGRIEAIQLLLEHGADISASNRLGITPLHLAVHSGNLEAATYLLAQGAPLQCVDKTGNTLMHVVVMFDRKENLDVARFLVDQKLSVTARNKQGNTPLHLAVENDAFDMMPFLIAQGALVNAPNKKKNTPLIVAAKMGSDRTVDILLQAGADPHLKNADGQTPLELATHEGWQSVIQSLTSQDSPAAIAIGVE